MRKLAVDRRTDLTLLQKDLNKLQEEVKKLKMKFEKSKKWTESQYGRIILQLEHLEFSMVGVQNTKQQAQYSDVIRGEANRSEVGEVY